MGTDGTGEGADLPESGERRQAETAPAATDPVADAHDTPAPDPDAPDPDAPDPDAPDPDAPDPDAPDPDAPDPDAPDPDAPDPDAEPVPRRAIPPEIRHFVATLNVNRPRATWALVGTLLVVYAIGAAWGAPDLRPAVLRMGALSRDRVLGGEVWRLLSSSFLHGSLVHLAANTYVLWSLATVERIVGTPRFLVLYALSALGGAALSITMSDGLSVGASGAIWGLMTALFALSLRRGLFPGEYARQLRNGLVQSLFVNVAISFAPGVDWAGHAGGGIVGFALGASGLLCAGMPRWGTPAREPLLDRVPALVRIGAPLAALALGGALVAALAIGRPWTLADAPTLARAPLGESGRSLLRPVALAPAPSDDPEQHLYGDLAADAALLAVSVRAIEPADAARSREGVYAAIADELARAEDAPLPGGIGRVEVDGAALLVARYRIGDARMTRAYRVRDGEMVSVELYAWDEVAEAWEGVAERTAASVE